MFRSVFRAWYGQNPVKPAFEVLVTLAVLIGGSSIVMAEARTLPNEVFTEFLREGDWSNHADDNITGETLSPSLINRIVNDYKTHPNDPGTQSELGLLALAMGIAEWGVKYPPAGLPPDPAGMAWGSKSGSNSGKHLMSYAVGGVGISHADQGDLIDFITYVGSTNLVPSAHRDAYRRLANPTIYSKRRGVYDQLRAAGVCSSEQFDTDLNGEKFNHSNVPHDQDYCAKYANSRLGPNDWRVFCTWTRVALRSNQGQKWLIERWGEKFWVSSLMKTPSGSGQIEEALVNVRIPNSQPLTADQALATNASDLKARIKRELDAYGAFSQRTLKRRCGIMLRPVVLYRNFAGEPELEGSLCPQ